MPRRPWIAALAVLLVALAAYGTWNRLAPLRPPRVAAGVTLLGHDISGWEAAQLAAWLTERAQTLKRPPLDAFLDPSTRGRVPGLAGRELDVTATVRAALAAQPKTRLSPVYRLLPPRVGLADLPPGPIYHGNPERAAAAITINVAWGEEFLPAMLSVLDRHRVKATFFLVGAWAQAHPAAARELASRGHEIGSHGYSTVTWENLSAAQMEEQIRLADTAILQATGVRPVWFSTHRGVVNNAILRTALQLGHETVMWSADTVDWKKPSVSWMTARVLARAKNGTIVLMHPTERSAEALDRILTGLEQRGLRVVPLGQLLSPNPLPEQEATPETAK